MVRVEADVKCDMYIELVIVCRGICVIYVVTCIVEHVGSVCRVEGGLSGDEGVIGVIHLAYARK